MRSMKKLLSSLLVVLLCLAFLAVPAYAEEGGEEPAYEAVDANGVQYPTLAAAFEAGGNITLAKDVTVGTTINVTIPTTLDLNGKTITSTVSGARLFEVSADFTINGNSGTITGNGAGYGAVRTAAGVTVNIIGGTYNYNTEEGAVFKGNATGSIFNISGATVSTNYWIFDSSAYMNGMTVTGGSYVSSGAGFVVPLAAGANFTMSGAYVDVQKGSAVEVGSLGGTATLTNNTITTHTMVDGGGGMGGMCVAFTADTTATINGGTYTAPGSAVCATTTATPNIIIKAGTFNGGIEPHTGTLTIEGGTFTNYKKVVSTGTATISGGTFDVAPAATDIAEGYAAILTDNGYLVHQHNPVFVDAKDPTCTAEGNEEHYFCSACGLYYKCVQNAAGENAPGEALSRDQIYSAPVHATKLVEEKAPACNELGVMEHYECINCSKLFWDKEGNDEITDVNSVNIAYAPHTATKHAATPSTCYSHGTIEYYECNVCYKWFSDEACTTEVTSLDAPLAAHDMKEYPAKTATCSVPGNVLYYECQDCGNFYLDVNGNQPTNLDAVVTTAEHSFEFRDEVPATNTTHGCMEHNYCTSCRSYFYPNSSQPVEYEDLILHALYFHDNVQTIGALKLNEEKKITVNSDTALYYSFTPETTGEYTFYTNNLEMNTPGVVIYTVLADGSGMMQVEPNYSSTPKYAGVGAYLNADQAYVVAVYGMENAGSLETVIGVCQPGGTATHVYFGREIEIFAKVYWGESLFGDPIGSVIRDCTVKSSDESILQVGFDPEFQMVNLYGLKVGTATVTVTTPAGNSTTCKVIVKPIPELAVGAPQTVAVKGWDGTVLSFTPKADGVYDLYVGKAAESLEFYVVDNKTGPAEGTELDEEGKFGFRYTLKGGVEYIIQAANPRDADVTTSVNVAMVSHTHNLTKTAAVASTCKEQGSVEYYTCAACSKIFADAQAKTEITDTKAALAAHTLTKVAAKDATYTDAGNVEYYSCSVCSKLFSDAEAKTETTLEKVTVPQMIEVVGSKAEVSEEAMDAAIEAAGTAGNVTLDLTKDEVVGEETAAVSSAVIPVASLEKVADAGASLTLTKADATVTMDAKALESIAKAAGTGTVTLVVQEVKTEELAVVQQNAVKDKKVAAVISAELINTATNENIGTEADGGFGGGTVTVQIPFTPEEGYKGTDYTVFYVADNGAVTEIKTEYKDGCLVVALNHFSEYVVVNTSYVKPSTGTNPATGDYGMVMPLAIMLLCGVAAAGLIIGKKKYNF